jgi:hypothetical protein
MFIFLEAVGPIYATSLSPPLFIEVSVPSQECEHVMNLCLSPLFYNFSIGVWNFPTLKKRIIWYVLIQTFPPYPGKQSHLYVGPLKLHVPLLWHGPLVQGVTEARNKRNDIMKGKKKIPQCRKVPNSNRKIVEPCHNNGTCNFKGPTYKCDCLPGYGGNVCMSTYHIIRFFSVKGSNMGRWQTV